MTYASPATFSPSAHEAPDTQHATLSASLHELSRIGDDYIVLSGPAAGGTFDLGDGTYSAWGLRIGGRSHAYGTVTLGATSVLSGVVKVAGWVDQQGHADDRAPATAAARIGGIWHNLSAKTDGAWVVIDANGGGINATTPATWAAGDLICWQIDIRQRNSGQTLR